MEHKIYLHEISVQQALSIIQDDFINEKDLCNHIEENIKEIVLECFGMEYLSHQREFKVNPLRLKINGSHTFIDFCISTKCGKTILMECKKPKVNCELNRGLGQILNYGATFNSFRYKPDLLVLASTKLDHSITSAIEAFRLPILFLCIDKKRFLLSSLNHFTVDKQ